MSTTPNPERNTAKIHEVDLDGSERDLLKAFQQTTASIPPDIAAAVANEMLQAVDSTDMRSSTEQGIQQVCEVVQSLAAQFQNVKAALYMLHSKAPLAFYENLANLNVRQGRPKHTTLEELWDVYHNSFTELLLKSQQTADKTASACATFREVILDMVADADVPLADIKFELDNFRRENERIPECAETFRRGFKQLQEGIEYYFLRDLDELRGKISSTEADELLKLENQITAIERSIGTWNQMFKWGTDCILQSAETGPASLAIEALATYCELNTRGATLIAARALNTAFGSGVSGLAHRILLEYETSLNKAVAAKETLRAGSSDARTLTSAIVCDLGGITTRLVTIASIWLKLRSDCDKLETSLNGMSDAGTRRALSGHIRVARTLYALIEKNLQQYSKIL